jgi:hypothetical protein
VLLVDDFAMAPLNHSERLIWTTDVDVVDFLRAAVSELFDWILIRPGVRSDALGQHAR